MFVNNSIYLIFFKKGVRKNKTMLEFAKVPVPSQAGLRPYRSLPQLQAAALVSLLRGSLLLLLWVLSVWPEHWTLRHSCSHVNPAHSRSLVRLRAYRSPRWPQGATQWARLGRARRGETVLIEDRHKLDTSYRAPLWTSSTGFCVLRVHPAPHPLR